VGTGVDVGKSILCRPWVSFILAWIIIAGLIYAAWRLPAQIFPRIEAGQFLRLVYGIIAAVNMTTIFARLPAAEIDPPGYQTGPVLFTFVALLMHSPSG
jgi:hypothetical protein